MCNQKFELISRLQNEADLRYLSKGERRVGKGRMKQYDGKMYYKTLSKEYFKAIEVTEDLEIY